MALTATEQDLLTRLVALVHTLTNRLHDARPGCAITSAELDALDTALAAVIAEV